MTTEPAPQHLRLSSSLDREPLLQEVLDPSAYLSEFLRQGVRPEHSRPLHACRPTTILTRCVSKGANRGSALVRVGNSQCIASTHLEVGTCILQSSGANVATRGEIAFRVSGDEGQQQHKSSSDSSIIEGFLYGIFNSTKVIDLSKLRIHVNDVDGAYKNLAWRISVQVVCLNNDGNLKDVCFLAALAALMDTTLPTEYGKDYTIVDDICTNVRDGQALGKIQILNDDDDGLCPKLVSFAFRSIPVPLTFGLCRVEDNNKHDEDKSSLTITKLIVDPTSLEERSGLLDGNVTIVVAAKPVNNEETNTEMEDDKEIYNIVAVDKPGGIILNVEILAACIEICKGRATDILGLISSTNER